MVREQRIEACETRFSLGRFELHPHNALISTEQYPDLRAPNDIASTQPFSFPLPRDCRGSTLNIPVPFVLLFWMPYRHIPQSWLVIANV